MREITQINSMRSLMICLKVLVQATTLISTDECSAIVADTTFLRALDTHMLNGSVRHRAIAYLLLHNLVLNSDADALRIVKDSGIMMRIYEGMAARRDSSSTFEANITFL